MLELIGVLENNQMVDKFQIEQIEDKNANLHCNLIWIPDYHCGEVWWHVSGMQKLRRAHGPNGVDVAGHPDALGT